MSSSATHVAHSLVINIPNAIEERPGFLLGGAPTATHLEQAVALGYKSFIDLRTPAEMGAEEAHRTLTGLGAPYVAIAVAGANGLTRNNALALDRALALHESPTMLFCASGNRVGALLALRAYWLHGASADEAMKIGLATGLTSLEGAVVLLLQQPASQES